ncbi:siderophore-interacting protein [Blastococcus sp. CT_GayMR16]|uniref:siderophore-interacting protein n=1 Tax=Blastococcus sp. CT_GayMR16 TaxID=2559607 RepID=UPI001073056A|nr:siderophore-interacting protein [Blastococcus sp. CT_GayMR16]TFV86034.1 siderophore-interacting protein [Blastococcus sp. CT_GayMR16]
MTVEAPQIPAYRTFAVRVSGIRRLSPSFLRVTFTGDDLRDCAPNGWDQRIKLLLPLPGRGISDCPTGPDWYEEWRALPPERQNPIRTYTVRATRPEAREIDVDFVLHGATGPASAWAGQAAVGDEVALVAPNARFPGPTGGYEWHPPADASCLVVAGDETAVPAVCAIVESLPAGRPARILLEIPTADDVLPLAAPDGVEVTWLPRRVATEPAAPHGALLTAALVRAVQDLPGATGTSRPSMLDDVDVDASILWEVPEDTADGRTSGPYVWLAGEAGTIKGLRRHLVQEAGLDRTSIAFMGYWRLGRVSD